MPQPGGPTDGSQVTESGLCWHAALGSSRGLIQGLLTAAAVSPHQNPSPAHETDPEEPGVCPQAVPALRLGAAACSPRTPSLQFPFGTAERHPNPCVEAEMKNWLAHAFAVELGDFCACRLTASLLLARQVSACSNPGTNQCHGCEVASSLPALTSSFPRLLGKRSYLWTRTR